VPSSRSIADNNGLYFTPKYHITFHIGMREDDVITGFANRGTDGANNDTGTCGA
jgi:hypothetical protein